MNFFKIACSIILSLSCAAAILTACGDKTPNRGAASSSDAGTGASSAKNNLVSEPENKTPLENANKEEKTVVSKTKSDPAKENDEKTTQQSPGKVDKKTEKSPEKRTEKQNGAKTTKKAEKPTEKFSEKPTEKQNEAKTTKKAEKPTEKFSEKPTKKQNEAKTTKKAEKPTEKQEKISEISNGISVMARTSPVSVGSSAVIVIQGVPGKEYELEFYETPSKKANYDDVKPSTAGKDGLASWSFIVRPSCQKGERKIVVSEKGSKNFAQTSIVVK